ncbi:MAG: hypothetical protein L6Q37_12470 [Bdellovibrionaceae bacterium]|nr:hypothetical protein [Pseudobdellovibrionaceae bacterium]NUM58859.1 hypothetical protein [Pseudobdellovibrionaceae bacterium]
MKISKNTQPLYLMITMLLISIINMQTIDAAPGARPNPPRYDERRPGYIRPEPNRPVPGYPRYDRPEPIYRPQPIRPIPVPIPVPIRPAPIYPPVYPAPVYPSPIYENPGYSNYETQKILFLNRMVSGESFNLGSLLNINSYSGFRLNQVRVNVISSAGSTIQLLINGRVVDSQYSYGEDVYLNPSYEDEIGYEVSSVRLRVKGSAFIRNVTVELSDR